MTQGNQGYGQQSDPYGQGPSYASPQYGPGSYGQPVGGAPSGRERSVGVLGLTLAVIGAAAVVVAFLAPIDWGKNDRTTYSKIHDILGASPDNVVGPVAGLYFVWLGWAVLAAAFVFALVAVLPSGASGAFRTLGLLVGLGGGVLTVFALKLTASDNPGLVDYLKGGRVGFYLAVAGFVVIGIGAVTGPRKVR